MEESQKEPIKVNSVVFSQLREVFLNRAKDGTIHSALRGTFYYTNDLHKEIYDKAVELLKEYVNQY